MRETRLSGSEGGAVQPNMLLLPQSLGEVHESPLPIESALHEDSVQVGIESLWRATAPPHELSRRGVGDHGSALDPPARGRSVQSTADALEGATFDQLSKLNAGGSKALKVMAPSDVRLLHHTADNVGERCSGCYLSSASTHFYQGNAT